ncbi:MAG: hypothetical protein IIY07_08560, partial [Thermoguttaceae bacterium]|nr:hypothetical protein [Thermoguttaceae bacterium]
MKKKLLEFPLACCAAFGVCWSTCESLTSISCAAETPYLTRVGGTLANSDVWASSLDAVKSGATVSALDVEIAPTQFNGRPLQQAAKRTFGITRGLANGFKSAEQIERELGEKENARANERRAARRDAAPVAPAPVPAPAKTETAVAQEAVATPEATREAEAREAAEKATQEAVAEQAPERSAEEKTRALTGDQADAPDARVDLPEVDPAELAPTDETNP